MSLELASSSAMATAEVGRRLGEAARPGDVVLIEGELGSGKTVLVQGIAAGLEAGDDVASPTFVLVRHHAGRLPLIHADLYRLGTRAEVEALGLLELSAEGVLAVEWSDRAPWLADALDAVTITLGPGPDPAQRVIAVRGGPGHLLRALAG